MFTTSSVFGPRPISAGERSTRPIRLVNQLESGTSSMVFTLSARMEFRSPFSKKVFSTKSQTLLPSTGAARLASNSRSLSTWMGSSG